MFDLTVQTECQGILDQGPTKAAVDLRENTRDGFPHLITEAQRRVSERGQYLAFGNSPDTDRTFGQNAGDRFDHQSALNFIALREQLECRSGEGAPVQNAADKACCAGQRLLPIRGQLPDEWKRIQVLAGKDDDNNGPALYPDSSQSVVFYLISAARIAPVGQPFELKMNPAARVPVNAMIADPAVGREQPRIAKMTGEFHIVANGSLITQATSDSQGEKLAAGGGEELIFEAGAGALGNLFKYGMTCPP